MDPIARDEPALAQCRARAADAHARDHAQVKSAPRIRRAADDFFARAVAELKSKITVAVGSSRLSAGRHICAWR
jgi:hypothetical protein